MLRSVLLQCGDGVSEVTDTQNLCQFPDAQQFTALAQAVTGKAGSVFLAHGLCWHDTSSNQSDQPRVSVLGHYSPRFIRPLESLAQYLAPDFLEKASPKLRQLMGYEFHASLLADVQGLQVNRF